MTTTTEQSYAERTITETTEVGDVPLILAAQGLTITSVTRRGGGYLATLRVRWSDGLDARIDAATGSGPTLASALEDARQGWVRWRDGNLRRRSPATGEHEALADVLGAWSAEGEAATRND